MLITVGRGQFDQSVGKAQHTDTEEDYSQGQVTSSPVTPVHSPISLLLLQFDRRRHALDSDDED